MARVMARVGAVHPRLRIAYVGTVALALLVALACLLWRDDLLSWGVLEAQVPQAPVHPLINLTAPPSVRTIEVPYAAGTLLADVYTPAGSGPFGGIELVNGVEPHGRRLPEFVQLADALARAGYVVVAPDVPGLVHEAVTPRDVDAVVDAFQAMAATPRVARDRMGMVGFSIGASLELVAASDPRIRDEVRVVDDVGGYSRLADVVEVATTHSLVSGGEVVPYVPNPYVWEVGRNSLIAMLPNAADRAALSAMFAASQPDPVPAEAGRAAELSADGRAMYALFTNRDPRLVDGIIARLPAEVRERMAALSPDSHVGQVTAFVRIAHDRGDPFIPVQESRLLASAPALRGHSSLLELDVLQHVELAAPDVSPGRLFGFYVPQMAKLNGYVRDTLSSLRA